MGVATVLHLVTLFSVARELPAVASLTTHAGTSHLLTMYRSGLSVDARRRLRILLYQIGGTFCALCGNPLPAPASAGVEIDHVQPRSQGGSDSLSNLRLVHASCNHSRQSRQPAREWCGWCGYPGAACACRD